MKPLCKCDCHTDGNDLDGCWNCACRLDAKTVFIQELERQLKKGWDKTVIVE